MKPVVPAVTPLCPVCGRLPYRPDHTIVIDDGERSEDVFTLCVHCITPLKLMRDHKEWEAVSEEEALKEVDYDPEVTHLLQRAFRSKREGTWQGPKVEEGNA